MIYWNLLIFFDNLYDVLLKNDKIHLAVKDVLNSNIFSPYYDYSKHQLDYLHTINYETTFFTIDMLDEKNKDYVSASTIIGVSNIIIMFKHILPNILRPVLVIGTIGLALAIIAESTLSFLGVGVPPTTPSLGTLIRLGNDFLFSGEWWITFFPAIFLVILAFSINLLGDWMRDTLNPRLKK